MSAPAESPAGSPPDPVAGPEPLVQAQGVSLRIGGRNLLSHVDLAVSPGEIVTLVGPNGAGKTTLLKVVLGLMKPDVGRLQRLPGLTLGYVPQRFAVDPVLPLSARRLLSLPRAPKPERLAEVLAEVGAQGLLDQPVQALSGGELQRLLLARALLRDPQLLVLDEPLQGVDFAGQTALFELIRSLRNRRGCGVLMVSHDLHLVMAGTDRVVCLNRHVCCSGRPEAVTRHPEYVALFGPKTAQSLAVYVHEHDHEHDLHGRVVDHDHDDGHGHDHHHHGQGTGR